MVRIGLGSLVKLNYIEHIEDLTRLRDPQVAYSWGLETGGDLRGFKALKPFLGCSFYSLFVDPDESSQLLPA